MESGIMSGNIPERVASLLRKSGFFRADGQFPDSQKGALPVVNPATDRVLGYAANFEA